ncbi:MAG: dihydrofolate reductase family protein [Thaumarchaeota archaeon]|nr:dihydrofolate reductase family protein [Nitrososphaerota archaeon]
MRKLIADSIISLDGFFTSSTNEIDSWFDFDEDEWQWSIDINRGVGAILLGRVTYGEFSQFWPKVTPRTKLGQIIARQLNELPKIVFSRSLTEAPWKPATIVREDPSAAVAKLKRESGKDLVVAGSGTLVAALTRDALIDEYFIRIRPIILGAGRPLFVDPNARHPLKLISAKTFKSGLIGLHYALSPSSLPERT